MSFIRNVRILDCMRQPFVLVTSVLLSALNLDHVYFPIFLIPAVLSLVRWKIPKVIGPLSLFTSLLFHDIDITALSLELVILSGE